MEGGERIRHRHRHAAHGGVRRPAGSRLRPAHDSANIAGRDDRVPGRNYLANPGRAYGFSPLNLEAAIVEDRHWLILVNAIEFVPARPGR